MHFRAIYIDSYHGSEFREHYYQDSNYRALVGPVKRTFAAFPNYPGPPRAQCSEAKQAF